MNFRMDYAKLEKRAAKKAKKSNPKKTINTKTAEANTKVRITGRRVVVTGSIPGMTRIQVGTFLNRHRAELQPAVRTNTSYLIVGNTHGLNTTKLATAQRLGIPRISYTMIEELKIGG